MSIIEQIKALQAELTRLEGDLQRKRIERDRLNDEVQVAEEKVTAVKDKLVFFSSV